LSASYVISTTPFNAIISLQTISLSVSYIPPILFFMLRKIRGEHIPYGPFKLGRYGIATNVLALAYLYVVIWMPFPTMLPVTGSNMNYAGPLLGTVIVGALVDGHSVATRGSRYLWRRIGRCNGLGQALGGTNFVTGCNEQIYTPPLMYRVAECVM
jgi:hypothetical protein